MIIPFGIAVKILRMSDHISGYNFLEAIGMNRKQIIEEMSQFIKIYVYNGTTQTIPFDCEFCYVDDSVNNIDMSVFAHHINLQSIRLPDHITRINPGSFSMCYSLKNIKLPKNLVSIGLLSFGNCKSLKDIIIPENVRNIESYAFTSCPNLRKINIQGEEPEWGSCVFTSSYNVLVRFTG